MGKGRQEYLLLPGRPALAHPPEPLLTPQKNGFLQQEQRGSKRVSRHRCHHGPLSYPQREEWQVPARTLHRVWLRNEELCWAHWCATERSLLHRLSPDPLASWDTALALEISFSLQQSRTTLSCTSHHWLPGWPLSRSSG